MAGIIRTFPSHYLYHGWQCVNNWKYVCLFTKDGQRIVYTFVRLFQKAVTNENISPLKEDGQLKIQNKYFRNTKLDIIKNKYQTLIVNH